MSGSASLGLEQAILGHTLGFAPLAFPARVYVGLCSAALEPTEATTGIEIAGGGYIRQPATFALVSSPANVAANTTTIEWPVATAPWGSIGYFELWDAQTDGTRLYWGAIVDPGTSAPLTIDVEASDIVRFSAGTLSVGAGTGEVSVGVAGVSSFNTRTGDVVLDSDDITSAGGALLAGPQTHTGTHTFGSITGPLTGAHTGSVGATTPSTGAFTTLSATSTISGAGFTTWLAAPPPIGATTPSTGAFTRIRSNPAGTQISLNVGTSADGFANNWLWSNTRWFGKLTGPEANVGSQLAINKIVVSDAGTATGQNINAFYVFNAVTGTTDATNTANRIAISGYLTATAQVGAAPVSIGPGVDDIHFIGHLALIYSSHSQGGLGGWTPGNNPSTGYFRGSVFGGNDNARLAPGADNMLLLCGREIDVSIQGTATAYARYGIIESAFISTSQAIGDDAGLVFVVENTNTFGHKNAIQFGTTGADLAISDSLMKVVTREYGVTTVVPPAYVNGIDFRQATFSGVAVATPGFAVDGDGDMTAKSLKYGTLPTNAATDAAAASAGVPVGGTYRNGSVLMVRVV